MGAAMVQGAGTLVVSAYFVVASQLTTVTLFGTAPTVADEREADALLKATGMALVVGVLGMIAVAAVHAYFRDRWGRRRLLSWSRWLAVGWLAGAGIALVLVPSLPNADKPVGFGVVWLAVGAIAAPLALVVAQARRGPVDPA